jgi:serine/threonine protein kinase
MLEFSRMAQKHGTPRAAHGPLPCDALVGNRYLVRALLGQGGMSYVYRVADTARGHDVALKQLRPVGEWRAAEPLAFESDRPRAQHANIDAARYEQRLALFQREYHTLAELAHPRIIEVYEYGFEQGTPYYTMELLTGRDISVLAPAPWPRVCAVMRDVASALTLLHSRRLLHRDLSPNNVHQQPDGFCKLIDFGAMGAMGKPNEIVGTPPFMAPELLRQLPLDARSDLYSLAALAYYLLTGRTVYPARTLAALYEFANVRPSAPSSHAAGVPRGLDALLVQLLSPDPAARLATTAELLERLSAIDGVEQGPPRRSLPATVGSPGLVGRSSELKSVKRRMSQALHGKGSSLLITGAAGSGRSRFLDACVLVGRLAGARVLRGSAEVSQAAPYGVFAMLLRQLAASLGSAEREELAVPEDVARALWPDDARPEHDERASTELEWAALQVSLLSYLSRVSGRRCLMIAIDDLERVDNPSARLLAALAERAESDKLLVIATLDSETLAAPPEAVRAYRSLARELPLAALSLADSQGLLASVFGDVPNLAPLAARVHGLSGGNPRLTMELAQHLVDVGVIRCQLGGYSLPELISSRDLPTSLGEALRARVRRLSPGAQALSSTLAICGSATLSAEESFSVSELSPSDLGPAALAELGEAAVAELRGERLMLRQPAMADAVRSSLSAAAQRALHARIAAKLIADPARMVQAADHYFHAELASQAVDALLSATTSSYAGRIWHAGYASLVERAVAACERFDRPRRDAFALQHALVQQSMGYNEPCEREQLLSFGRLLHRMAGLSDWEEVDPKLAASERIAEALRRAEARYQATPEHERVLAPLPALRLLVAHVTKMAGFASTTLDLDLLKALPSLAPFAALGPAIATAQRLAVSLRSLREGYVERYREFGVWVCDQLAQEGGAGLPASEARAVAVNIKYGLGLIEGMLGYPTAFEYANEIESWPNHRINAWRVRRIAHLYLADPDAADVCRREIEALQMQDCSRQYLEGSPLEIEALAYGMTDDLLGLRRSLPALEEMAQKHEGWRTKLLVARADLQRVRGRTKEALELYEAALARVPEAKHALWGLAASGQLRMLVELGRSAEACELGLHYSRLGLEWGWELSLQAIQLALADAEAALGRFEDARTRVDALVAAALAARVRGLHLGILYEAGARHAVLAQDGPAFAHYYRACAEQLRRGRHPALTARLDRLLDQAGSGSLAPVARAEAAQNGVTIDGVIAQLAACSSEERGAEALKLLMTATGATAGHLYKVHAGQLDAVASYPNLPASPHLQDFLLRYLEGAQVMNEQTADISSHPTGIESECVIETLLLTVPQGCARTIVGVVALSFAAGRRRLDPALVETIAEQLADPTDAS